MPNRRRNLGARPPKPPAERRSEGVLVKSTPSEYEAVVCLAGDLPLAEYLRRLVARAAVRRRR